MSLLRWFSSDKQLDAASTIPVPDSRNPDLPTRAQRMAHRDQLFGVIRESMLNSGVLSSGFRFKVLSLDGRGEEFLVMMDLPEGAAGDIAGLGHVERAIVDTALTRHGIVVKAVYWREYRDISRPGVASNEPGEPDTVMLVSQPMPLETGAQRDTGFADTEAVADDRRTGLSPTQDGDLR